MAKIYTRMGDAGETSTHSGQRLKKNDALIEAQGTIDECNSALGVARAFVEDPSLDETLKQIQNTLLMAGSEVTCTQNNTLPPFISEASINELEALIDRTDAKLAPLTNFILPAGGKASAQLHVARCVARKVERRLVTLADEQAINPLLLTYFNRLSDALFLLARLATKRSHRSDEIWESPLQK